MRPWQDRRGRLAPLKAVVFALLFGPAGVLLGRMAAADLGPRPLTEIIHETGLWGLRLLFLALAVTPLRETLRWPQLILVRRMIGVAAFAYLVIHLTVYIGDQGFDLAHVAAEIASRIYLTIGFGALLMLAALAATSTDGAIRLLGGRRWQALHRLAYPAALLATVHFFLQSKLDVREATVMAGLYVWLMLYRVLRALRRPAIPGPVLLGLLALLVGVVTFGGEALYFWQKSGVDPWRVLAADLSLRLGPRPGWIVLGIALAVALAAALRRITGPAAGRPAAS
jgi:sulfoxide reductase heme-binding subunit YedZ